MRMILLRLAICLTVAITAMAPERASAVLPDEVLSDATLEARARALSRDLRCVVCRNQSIDDSNAGIARDMRIILRERLVAGDSDEEAVAYLVSRYGSYVLLNPPVRPLTYLLWLGPALLLLATLFGFSQLWKQRDPPQAIDLTAEDRALAKALLDERPKE
ncbi:MAG: cytochrome c-type biogenesis protein CcmH [Rhodobacteraceae bacterium]|nr:cytochrome c-type biogenesis protein CcmH [Paracoccaceae bacterium]